MKKHVAVVEFTSGHFPFLCDISSLPGHNLVWKVQHMCSSHHQDHSAFIDATPLQYTSALAALGRMSRWQQVLSSLKCLLFGLFVPETDGNILEPGFAL